MTKLNRSIISQSEEFLVSEKNILVSLTGLGSSRTAHQDVTKTTNSISNQYTPDCSIVRLFKREIRNVQVFCACETCRPRPTLKSLVNIFLYPSVIYKPFFSAKLMRPSCSGHEDFDFGLDLLLFPLFNLLLLTRPPNWNNEAFTAWFSCSIDAVFFLFTELKRNDCKDHWVRENRRLEGSVASISQVHKHAQQLKLQNTCGPLYNQTWQTEWSAVV